MPISTLELLGRALAIVVACIGVSICNTVELCGQ